MRCDFPCHVEVHLPRANATHPIVPPWGALGALLLLAGRCPLRRRAFPAHPMTVHSGASNCRCQVKEVAHAGA